MADHDFLRRPLLAAPLSFWADRIRQIEIQIMRDDDRVKTLVYFQSRLTNLLDLNSFSPNDQSNLFDQSVDIALFQITNRGGIHRKVPCAALDMESNTNPKKEALFEKAGLPYIKLSGSTTELDQDILAEIDRRWRQPSSGNQHLSKKLDRNEVKNIDHLSQMLRPLDLIYLPQQGLREILTIPPGHKEKVQRRIEDHRRRYGGRTSFKWDELTTVDGVIATSSPVSIPIAVLEFDGHVHRSESNKDLEQKRLKDELKNGVMEAAHLPLIRFSHGPDVGEENERLGWEALAGFVRQIRDLVQNDAYQAYAMQQMVLSEVRALGGVEATNIEGLLEDFVRVLQDKADALEHKLQKKLEDAAENFDLAWTYRDREEQFWGVTVPEMKDSRSIHDFYSRSSSLVLSNDSIGWRLSCSYKRRKFEFDSINNALNKKPAELQLDSQSLVPLRVYGSKYAKELLGRHCMNVLRPNIELEEQKEFLQLVDDILDSIEEAAHDKERKLEIGHIRRGSNAKFVEDLIRGRVGLDAPLEIWVSPDDDGSEAHKMEKVRLLKRREQYIELLREANRSDFDPEEIDILYEELTKLIENRLENISFYSTGMTRGEMLQKVVGRRLGESKSAPRRSVTWKLGETPRKPK